MDMKVAIPLFGNRISPRFDFSPEMKIISFEKGEVINQEHLSMGHLSLSQRLDHLISSEVNQVICGGIDIYCLDQLTRSGIQVLPNIVGEAEIALRLFLNGRLRPGRCCDSRGRRRPCRLQKGIPGGSS
jgi:predicted Fe-Mo cluster-binding NifX family protein